MSLPSSVIILGAGPAGLFAAHELVKLSPTTHITIIEQGSPIETRSPPEAMTGVGGAGTFSDGKLHFTPVLSHEKLLDLFSLSEYQQELDYVDQLFTDFGVTAPYTPENLAQANALVDHCQSQGIKLYIRRCRHVGSDHLPLVVANIVKYLKDKGVEFVCHTKIDDLLVKNNQVIGLKSANKIFKADKYIVAPGRIGSKWLQQQAVKLKLDHTPEKIEIGVRVEFPATVMAAHSKILHENIYSIITPTFGDIVRTFCPCPNGSVAMEDYHEYVCVNGYSNSDLSSPNSNFNFTCPVTLTNPTENTTEYATLIAKLSSLLGDGKPQLQRLGDLVSGHRSTWEKLKNNRVTPSLKEVVPGDISLALPHRIITNIIEGLNILNRVLPGINDPSTLLYAPEIKLRGNRLNINKNMQTQIQNLYTAGDGAGVSGNIVGAAISGIFAARGAIY